MISEPRKNLLLNMPQNAVCAEIGVWKGVFSRAILDIAKPRELHLIDPWLLQPEFEHRLFGGKGGKPGKGVRSQADMDSILFSLQEEFGDLENVRFDRGFSEEVLPGFDDHYFDWLYIDGNHEYDYVVTDLKLSEKKVKPGGFITGNDYTWVPKERPGTFPPVKKAVDEFVIERGLENRTLIGDNQFIIQLPSPQ